MKGRVAKCPHTSPKAPFRGWGIRSSSLQGRIPTPVCALVRNDRRGFAFCNTPFLRGDPYLSSRLCRSLRLAVLGTSLDLQGRQEPPHFPAPFRIKGAVTVGDWGIDGITPHPGVSVIAKPRQGPWQSVTPVLLCAALPVEKCQKRACNPLPPLVS